MMPVLSFFIGVLGEASAGLPNSGSSKTGMMVMWNEKGCTNA
jgi:hypothetical protein